MLRFIRKICYTLAGLAISYQILANTGVFEQIGSFIETVKQIEIPQEVQDMAKNGAQSIMTIVNDTIASNQ